MTNEPKRTIEEIAELVEQAAKRYPLHKYWGIDRDEYYEEGFIDGYSAMLEIYDAKCEELLRLEEEHSSLKDAVSNTDAYEFWQSER